MATGVVNFVGEVGNGGGPEGAIGAISRFKTYESKFIYHDFVQFVKQHSRYKAILPSKWFAKAVSSLLQY